MGKVGKASTEKSNPFNLKINRQKHSILGQKVKGSCGTPTISHGISNLKRKSMLNKVINKKKANRFIDERLIDESKEESNVMRLVCHQRKKFQKNIFNLNDEEKLTHSGQALDEMEDFDDQINELDDDEGLDEKFVSKAHFGGFSNTDTQPTKKEMVSQLIADNKQKKYEKQVEKQNNIDLTEKLDTEWKNLHLSLKDNTKSSSALESKDSYDIIFHELQFEPRATPSSRLISPEEIAKIEKEKIAKLESERNLRMIDDHDRTDQISADSIYDGMLLEKIYSNEKPYYDSDNDSAGYESNSSDKISEENNTCSDIKLKELEEALNSEKKICSDNILEEIKSIVKNCNVDRQNVEEMFSNLLTQLFLICKKPAENQRIVTLLFHELYKLSVKFPVETAEQVLKCLDAEQKAFQNSKDDKKTTSIKFETLVLFNLCTYLYSVSDFQHPVITPAAVFMGDMMHSKMLNSSYNIIARLFLSKLFLKWNTLSKRFVPEAIAFLNGVLQKMLDKKFQVNKKTILLSNYSPLNLFSLAETNFSVDNSTIISISVEQLCQYAEIYCDLPSYAEIFYETRILWEKISQVNQSIVSKLCVKLSMKDKLTKKYITFPHTKPKPLKMFEPFFYSKFCDKYDDIHKKRIFSKNISKKIRKEEKSFLREVRKDSRTLASEKLEQQLMLDEERRLKVKKIYSDLALQQGDYNKLKKKKILV